MSDQGVWKPQRRLLAEQRQCDTVQKKVRWVLNILSAKKLNTLSARFVALAADIDEPGFLT
jgi:hypothetical protein